jgi:hypothetical protein
MRSTYLTILVFMMAAVGGFDDPALAAGGRFAFVLGNSSYASLGTLPNPTNDASAIAKALTALNFEVDMHVDLKRDELMGILPRVAERARNADLVAFFYAGHGLAINNQNYIVPVDARLPNDQADVVDQMVALSQVMDALQGSAKATLIILDSCRNNPYNDDTSGTTRSARLGITRGLAEMSGALSKSTGRGLARMDTGGAGMFVAFATKPGEFAYDSPRPGAANSPFTAALVHNVATPGASLDAVMIRVRREVQQATDRRQLPWTQSSLVDEEVYLAERPQLADVSLAQQQRYDRELEARKSAEQGPVSSVPVGASPGSPPALHESTTTGTPVASLTFSGQAPPGDTRISSSNWDGHWTGRAGRWNVDATIQDGSLSARLTCRDIVYVGSADMKNSRKLNVAVKRISLAAADTMTAPNSVDIAGTFPELTVLTAVPEVPSRGYPGCAVETLLLQASAKH